MVSIGMGDKLKSSKGFFDIIGTYQLIYGGAILGSGFLLPILERKFKRIKEGFSDYFGLYEKLKGKNRVWIHGVSMGESMVACGFAQKLAERIPGLEIAFTTTHPDVLKTVQKKGFAKVSGYFPLDNLISMKRAFDRLNPQAVFVAETDFWPVFSYFCRKRNIPLVLLNGRISHKIEAFYIKFPRLADLVFNSFSSFLVQSSVDSERLKKLGVAQDKILVLGNMKADLTAGANKVDLENLIAWKSSSKLIVFGSLHPSEFKELVSVFKRLAEEKIKVLIAPRALENCKTWQSELNGLGIKTALKSKLNNSIDEKIIILDTMGELASVYSIGDIAFVGGSLDKKVGGHNPLEVLQYSKPLIMGPNLRNFQDIAEQLIQAEGIKISKSAEEVGNIVRKLVSDCDKAKTLADNGYNVLISNRGVLDKSLKIAEEILQTSEGKR
jgi:3-deoxy-D-manno-octulosonic-acid transferase